MRLTISTATDYALTMQQGQTLDIDLPAGTQMRIVKHDNWHVININTQSVRQCSTAQQLSKAIERIYTKDFIASMTPAS